MPWCILTFISENVYIIMQTCWQHQPKDRPSMPEIHASLQETFAEASCTLQGESKCIVCLDALAVVAMMPCGHRCVCEGCTPYKISSSNRPATQTRRPGGLKDLLGSDALADSTETDASVSELEPGCSDLFQSSPLCPMCRQPVIDTKRIYG